VTNWRIQKRIEEQFSKFAEGFNELIPQDLINVFDERELELLIGGIAEMDVDDWKKHTDYRGYTESDDVVQWFWKVRTPFWWEKGLVDGRRYGHGMRRKSLGCYSLRRGLRGFRLMGSRICRAVMGLVGLRSRKLEISVNFLKLILGTLPPFVPCRYHGHVFAPSFYCVSGLFSFNRIDMPPYKSYDQLVAKLSLAVEETVGFGQE